MRGKFQQECQMSLEGGRPIISGKNCTNWVTDSSQMEEPTVRTSSSVSVRCSRMEGKHTTLMKYSFEIGSCPCNKETPTRNGRSSMKGIRCPLPKKGPTMRDGSSSKKRRPTNRKRSASENENPTKKRRISSEAVEGPSKEEEPNISGGIPFKRRRPTKRKGTASEIKRPTKKRISTKMMEGLSEGEGPNI